MDSTEEVERLKYLLATVERDATDWIAEKERRMKDGKIILPRANAVLAAVMLFAWGVIAGVALI